MYTTNEFRKRLRIEIDGEPFMIVDNEFVKPGKGQAFVRTRLKSMISGKIVEKTFKSGEAVKEAQVEDHVLQYLYNDSIEWSFMNTETFEQVTVSKEHLEDKWKWLKENMECEVSFFKGQPVSIEPPTFVTLKITYCEPGVKGDTANTPSKPATLETGAVIDVPLFVKEGDSIRIDTRTGDYVDRA